MFSYSIPWKEFSLSPCNEAKSLHGVKLTIYNGTIAISLWTDNYHYMGCHIFVPCNDVNYHSKERIRTVTWDDDKIGPWSENNNVQWNDLDHPME